MIIETALEIKFNCLVPNELIVPGEKGVFKFEIENGYKTKPFQAEALTDFLNIPRLLSYLPESIEDLPQMAGPMQRAKQLKKRSDARKAFYQKWGFLTVSNEDASTVSNEDASVSETEAEFDAIHLELCSVNDQRTTNELKNTRNFRFTPPSTATWKVREYGHTKLPMPVYEAKNLASALYLYWFFAPKEMSSLKTCLRFTEYGPKSGCQVFFSNKSNKKYCCETCKKNSTARRHRSKSRKEKK